MNLIDLPGGRHGCQVSQAMQTVLTTVSDTIAQATGFMKRQQPAVRQEGENSRVVNSFKLLFLVGFLTLRQRMRNWLKQLLLLVLPLLRKP